MSGARRLRVAGARLLVQRSFVYEAWCCAVPDSSIVGAAVHKLPAVWCNSRNADLVSCGVVLTLMSAALAPLPCRS